MTIRSRDFDHGFEAGRLFFASEEARLVMEFMETNPLFPRLALMQRQFDDIAAIARAGGEFSSELTQLAQIVWLLNSPAILGRAMREHRTNP